MRQRNETQKRDEKLTDKKKGFKSMMQKITRKLKPSNNAVKKQKRGAEIVFNGIQKERYGFKYPKESLLASLEDFKEKSAFLKRTQTLKKSKGVINA
ncbi:hypothetical protein ACPDJP_04325 [Helicobacter pylori]|uniref:hypothetical protein n=1 Tax=Helicobacter pylori TaxID=210 RepID=UPI003DA8B84A